MSALFKRRGQGALDEIDIRQLAERFVRRQMDSSAVYCERARGGHVVMRVPSALLQHEVLLLEYDIATLLKQEADFTLRELSVTQS
ncbi:MAG: hypothetical protein HY372_03735 [Candidatus Andersenbacteria bacterium]|nr:hypothetical protein [Candidatus Andersenbacteria bacterium]